MNHLVGLRSNGCWTASAMFARNTAKLSLADASESPFLDWPRKGNPKEGYPASAPCGHPALRVRARRPRSAIAHPCASAACATSCRAPFGLLRPPVTAAEGPLEQRTLPACRSRVKSTTRNGVIDVADKSCEVDVFEFARSTNAPMTSTVTGAHYFLRVQQRSRHAPLSQGGDPLPAVSAMDGVLADVHQPSLRRMRKLVLSVAMARTEK